MTIYPLITATPESLVRDDRAVPEWARGGTTHERDGYGYECHEIVRDGSTVGWMYDDGAGYDFSLDEPEIDDETFAAALLSGDPATD